MYKHISRNKCLFDFRMKSKKEKITTFWLSGGHLVAKNALGGAGWMDGWSDGRTLDDVDIHMQIFCFYFFFHSNLF